MAGGRIFLGCGGTDIFSFQFINHLDNKKNVHPVEDERLVRGATSVRLFRSFNRNSPSMLQRGKKASLTHFGYGSLAAYTLCLDNGGNSGASYLILIFHSATLRAIRRRRVGEVLTYSSLSVPPFRRVLVLFTVFSYLVICVYILHI